MFFLVEANGGAAPVLEVGLTHLSLFEFMDFSVFLGLDHFGGEQKTQFGLVVVLPIH